MKKLASLVISITMIASLVLMSGCTKSQTNDTTETKEPIKLGYTGALTGPYNEYGEGAKRAFLVAIKQWNDKGGINGRQIELITKDDQLDPNKGQLNMKELLEVDKVDAILGPPGSSVALASLPLTEAQNVPVVNTVGTSPLITYPDGANKPPRKNVFSFCAPQDVETAVLADFVGQRYKKIGLLYESTAYGTGSSDLQVKRLKDKFSIDPVGREKYDQKDTSMTAQLTKLQKAGAEVVLMTGLASDAATIKKEMNRLGFNVQLVGTGALGTKAYVDLLGNLVEGTITDGYGIFDGNAPQRPVAKKFMEDYLKMWGHDKWYGEGAWPENFTISVCNYDAINVLLEGIKRAGSTDKNAVIQELNKFKDFEGVAINISFTPNIHHAVTVENLSMYTYKLSPDGKTYKLVPYVNK